MARLITDGIIQSDQGLKFELNIDFSGTINWNAMATGYGNIGTSYSANKLCMEQPNVYHWFPDYAARLGVLVLRS